MEATLRLVRDSSGRLQTAVVKFGGNGCEVSLAFDTRADVVEFGGGWTCSDHPIYRDCPVQFGAEDLVVADLPVMLDFLV